MELTDKSQQNKMNKASKCSLCDVPVIINVWIRPHILNIQFNKICESKPNVIFLISDGGRNEKEIDLINQSRKIVENIDWDCKVYKLYEQENQGMYKMIKKSLDFVFTYVDRCIYLEDDYIPSISYFRFCAELLEKYKDDERIFMINGMNHLGEYKTPNSDYFFSNEGSIWGIAFWKRTYDLFFDSYYQNDEYIKSRLLDHGRSIHKYKRAKNIISRKFPEYYLAGVEFNLGVVQLTQNQLIIVPTKNLISNQGCDESATHANELNKIPNGLRRIFNMKTYEYTFPLKHPRYVIPDYYYSKKIRRIMGYGYPIIRFYRKIESLTLHFVFGDTKTIKNKILKLIK